MEVTDYFEGNPEVAEYFQTSINTPINVIDIHASLPAVTDKTAATGSLAQAAFSIGRYYQSMGRPLDSVWNIGGAFRVMNQIVAPTFVVGDRYKIIGEIRNLENIPTAPSIMVSSREKRIRRYVQYLSDFTRSWNQRKDQFAGFRKDFVWDKFKMTIHELLQFKPDQISFNFTDDGSIFFKAAIKENNLYLELFFDQESEESVDAIVNIYKDGQVALAYGGSIEDTFGKIHELLFRKAKAIVPTAIPDAIPSPHFATAEF